MIEGICQLTEAEQLRKETRAARRKRRRGYLKKLCCKQCGEPKHYVCLEHHNFKKKGLEKLYSKFNRYARKFYFNLKKRLNFVE
ncbi:MAG: hypothetical protein M3T96_11235 [Acidobacteriota bacterium]|nr:hypothetical protein [Acidobacteriota bacterium]